LILTAIRDLSYAPSDIEYIFVTHAHLDHAGSLAAVKAATGAKIVAGSVEVDHLEGRKMLCSMRREGLGGNLFRGMLFVVEKFVTPYVSTTLDMAMTSDRSADDIAGFTVIDTPGHSPGSLSFLHGGKKLLFTGDALSGSPQLRLPPRAGCSSFADALHSSKKLAECDFDICLFGHGEPLIGNADTQVRTLL
jgi:glyoxylase-like metal-dependent hydrolase (beta-lactamase superfamily II)